MNLTKSSVVSGSTVVDGFLSDGKFIGSEPIPNYVVFEFKGHEENTISQFGFTELESDYELISMIGGGYVGDGQSAYPKLSQFFATISPAVTSNYPNNWVFQSSFGQPELPYSFPPGIILPKGARAIISFNQSLAFLRLIMKPVLPVVVNSLFSLP